MKKSMGSLITLAAIFSVTSCSQTSDPPAAGEWTEFTLPQGRCKVIFPGKPSLLTAGRTKGVDDSESYGVGTPEGSFEAHYYDLRTGTHLPQGTTAEAGPDTILDAILKDRVRVESSASLQAEKKIEAAGYPGRRATLTRVFQIRPLDDEAEKVKPIKLKRETLLCLAGKSLYELRVEYPEDSALDGKIVDRFFDSLALLERKGR